MMVSFLCCPFSPRGVLDEILNLIESVSEVFSSYSFNLSLFQNLWFHSLMNVLLNSYHVTAIPSLNHSLLDA